MLRSWFAFLLFITGLAGCTSSPPPKSSDGVSAQCEQSLVAFYQTVEDTRSYALPYHFDSRFPHLAFDRISASLTDSLSDEASRLEWLGYVSMLGQQQLATVLALTPHVENTKRMALTQCQHTLMEDSANDHGFWKAIEKNAPTPPTAYQHWKRVLGAYPIASVIAESRIKQEQAHIQRDFGRALAHPFHYSETRSTLSQEQIEKMMKQARQSSKLTWPMLDESQADKLLNHYSPMVTVETLSQDDLVGALAFDNHGKPIINTKLPRIYRSVSYTRFDEEILPQLNYVLWFPARTAKGSFDPYAGDFDAINLRLTLDTNGAPLIFDSIHQCGCFHMVYALSPTLRFTTSDNERPIENHLPLPTESARLAVSLTSGDHMISQVSFTDNIPATTALSAIALETKNLASLITLETPKGGVMSPFDRHGIIDESARGERWFLWPFGVRSPGAMRQQGMHAIAFIGERHFDDAYLFDELLERIEVGAE
ncbi:hypothetical protein LRP50_14035 [Enterovibrio sp. ZSDZ42]|uniref:Uncharacterized protein n=1 Tax=Enterovibrio gelatinilyticus TaxID=2899819 RepID=A0ABT5R1V2_9GAMM|nr:hypothetical protein [Enterovibrio sp. ZSDZ42]MDD1794257.1 hypothetical protein [Enterovibrio sp. ZSDZ42]